jgi:transposase InsO family protein
MDFMSERVADGRWVRILTVVDQFTRECLCLVADQSLTGEKVAQALEPVVMQRGAPRAITVDNGSEFASRVMDAWVYRHGIQLDFIRPGKPVENGFIESFNGGYGMNASMWKCFSRSRMWDRSWRGGSSTTIGVDPIVRWQTWRLRRLWPSGSRRPHRLTMTPLNYWRHSRELW